MTGFLESKEFWAALIGAGATIIAVFLAVHLGLRHLKNTEMDRLRIKCVADLVAFRFVLLPGSSAGVEAKTSFFSALNAIPGLFGGNEIVIRNLRDFRAYTRAEKNRALIQLIRVTAEVAGVPLTKVSDIDLKSADGT